MTIDLNKAYKTKEGGEVKLFLIDDNRVLGAYRYGNGKWYLWSWYTNGKALCYNTSGLDLVEVVEPIEASVYLAKYTDGSIYVFESKTPYDVPSFADKVYKKTVTFTEDDLLKD